MNEHKLSAIVWDYSPTMYPIAAVCTCGEVLPARKEDEAKKLLKDHVSGIDQDRLFDEPIALLRSAGLLGQ